VRSILASKALFLLVIVLFSRSARAQTVALRRIHFATARVVALEGVSVGQLPPEAGRGSRKYALPQISHGSALLISDKGLLLTAKHVVERGRLVTVMLCQHKLPYRAAVVWQPEGSVFLPRFPQKDDLAFLVINPASQPANNPQGRFRDWIELPDPARLPTLRPGKTTVFALGYPLEARFEDCPNTSPPGTFSTVITAPGDPFEGLLKLGLAVNQGNSGGPVVDDNDVPIGIATRTHTQAQGIGFAVPMKHAIDRRNAEVGQDTIDRALRRIASTDAEKEADLIRSIMYDPLGEPARLAAEILVRGHEAVPAPVQFSLLDDNQRAKHNAKTVQDPDIVVLTAAYVWNLRQEVLFQAGAESQLDVKDAKVRELLGLLDRLAPLLCRNAIAIDPGVEDRSPFVSFVLEATSGGSIERSCRVGEPGCREDSAAPPPPCLPGEAGCPDERGEWKPSIWERRRNLVGGYIGAGPVFGNFLESPDMSGFLAGGGVIFDAVPVNEGGVIEGSLLVPGLSATIGSAFGNFMFTATLDLGMRMRVGGEVGFALSAFYTPGFAASRAERRDEIEPTFMPAAFRTTAAIAIDDVSFGPQLRHYAVPVPATLADIFLEWGY
jgi:S1-C subfamily serine protease